jgi:hypothetical protein
MQRSAPQIQLERRTAGSAVGFILLLQGIASLRGPASGITPRYKIVRRDGIAREEFGLLKGEHHGQAHTAAGWRRKNKDAAVRTPVHLILAVVLLECLHDGQPPWLKVRSANSSERRAGGRSLRLSSNVQTAGLGCHGFRFRCFVYHYPGYARFRVAFQSQFWWCC